MIAILSDLHFHNFPDFAYPSEKYEGLNTRAEMQLHLFDVMCEKICESEIKSVFIAGDIFHRKNLIYVPLYNQVRHAFANAAEMYDLHFNIIPGNHDVVNRAGKNTSVEAFEDIEGVSICDSAIVIADAMEIHCVSWGDEIPKKKKSKKLKRMLITHSMVKGAKLNSAYVSDFGMSVKEILKMYDYAVVGDIHVPQLMNPKFLIPGSPWETTRGDHGESRGYWIFDDGKFKLQEIVCPVFISTDLERAISEYFEPDDYNYYTVSVSGTATKGDLDIIRKKYKNVELIIKGGGREASEIRTSVRLTDSKEQLIKKYIKESDTKLSKKKLLGYGEEIINA